MTKTYPDYLSTKDISFLLKISPRNARKMAEAGELDAVYEENQWRFPVEKWLSHPHFSELVENRKKQKEKSKNLIQAVKELHKLQRKEFEFYENESEEIHTYKEEIHIPYKLNPYLRKYVNDSHMEANEKLVVFTCAFFVSRNEMSVEEASKLCNVSEETFKNILSELNIPY